MATLRKSHGAFTFIEIMAVLIISGLVFNMAVSLSKNTLDRARQEREIFDCYSHICRLRNESICTLVQTRVRFYTDYNNSGKSACVFQFLEDNSWITKNRIILDKVKINSLTFPGGAINQQFSYKGQPLYTGSVVLKDSQGKFHYLVFYNTGRIRIKNET